MLKCKKHPKYKGLRKPTSGCETCWAIYLGMSQTCQNCGCQESERTIHEDR